MVELDVALSDGLLGTLALWLGWKVKRNSDDASLHGSLRLVFFSVAAGAWLGAIWHAFYAADTGMLSVVLWRLTMLSVGLTAYGFAMFGAFIVASKPQSWLRLFQSLLAIYALALIFSDDFLLAVAIYIPAVLLALAGFIFRRNAAGIGGLVLVCFASTYQIWGPDLHSVWLTHNAVYHLLLLPALLLFWLGASGVNEQAKPGMPAGTDMPGE